MGTELVMQNALVPKKEIDKKFDLSWYYEKKRSYGSDMVLDLQLSPSKIYGVLTFQCQLLLKSTQKKKAMIFYRQYRNCIIHEQQYEEIFTRTSKLIFPETKSLHHNGFIFGYDYSFYQIGLFQIKQTIGTVSDRFIEEYAESELPMFSEDNINKFLKLFNAKKPFENINSSPYYLYKKTYRVRQSIIPLLIARNFEKINPFFMQFLIELNKTLDNPNALEPEKYFSEWAKKCMEKY